MTYKSEALLSYDNLEAFVPIMGKIQIKIKIKIKIKNKMKIKL
jgi:hypothetical protein